MVIFSGQQIWCNSKADGHSPDERERETVGAAMDNSAFLRWFSPASFDPALP
ncbi:hypothetical protein MNBD_ALPHA11-1703 [hydrothermal vent metagenome]|uniref:Uncharacterized protein n=1 Tax=hydrothermal vent metagenome TaxID=652676 RepID=A0A3B0TWM7_9ZZZZ